MRRGVWTAALLLAVFWPSRVLSMFDGLPLDRTAEALALGVVLPICWILRRQFLDGRAVQAAILLLLALKIAGAGLLTQQGLCAAFSTTAPFHADVLTIPIDEPGGALRSWDVRADWRAERPRCTAIVDRPYESLSAFPVWFLNITDAVQAPPRRLTLDLNGFTRLAVSGDFAIDLDRDMTVIGTIGGQAVRSTDGTTVKVTLPAGVHAIALHADLTGDRWRLVPRWNGGNAFAAAPLTVSEPRWADHALAPLFAVLTTAVVIALIVGWTWSLVAPLWSSRWLLVWSVVASVSLAAASSGRIARAAPLLLLGGALVPIAARQRNLLGAFMLFGVPWLAFFAARSWLLPGHFSIYSSDDWLAYQAAGYRIVMNGYWLQGGTNLFDYQPLYRWISAVLHVVFGDSSVGETYWDAACLLIAGLLAFQLTRSVAGFRAGVIAGAATLSTFTLGTIWYFVGRGLSEIAGSGFLCLAAWFMLRARLGGAAPAAAAGVFAVLMFYTRLNHLLFALTLPVLLWPVRVPARWTEWAHAASAVRVKAAIIYGTVFGAGLVAFAARTWWYTGVFSIFMGTSLKNNDTGLRPSTIGSAEVWRRIGHSLWSLIWMNEPPHPDPRAAFVAVGAVLAVLAVLQVPRARTLPASISLAACGAMLSALLVHTHNYPGRMTIHLVPFAASLTVIGAAQLWRRARVPAMAGLAAG